MQRQASLCLSRWPTGPRGGQRLCCARVTHDANVINAAVSRRAAAQRCLGAVICPPSWWSRGACSAALLAELGGVFGGDTGRLSTAASVCEAHGKDESYHAAIGPDAVVFPLSTAEVSQASMSSGAHKRHAQQLHRQSSTLLSKASANAQGVPPHLEHVAATGDIFFGCS